MARDSRLAPATVISQYIRGLPARSVLVPPTVAPCTLPPSAARTALYDIGLVALVLLGSPIVHRLGPLDHGTLVVAGLSGLGLCTNVALALLLRGPHTWELVKVLNAY